MGFEMGISDNAMENLNEMKLEEPKTTMSLVNRYVQSLCGLYSRVARQLKVDRSYVSRVVRGERHSTEVESALSREFNRIMSDEAAERFKTIQSPGNV
jgi:hypothetical protein